LALFFSQCYSLENISRREWKVKTEGYTYRLDDEDGRELLAYHWHPWTPPTFPHLHLKRATTRPELQKAHIPTGRVSIEHVVRHLISDWSVPPRREDWESVLDENERLFTTYRTWG
jgi:hypothetical protein